MSNKKFGGYGSKLPRMKPEDRYRIQKPPPPYAVPYSVYPGERQSGLPSSFGALDLARGSRRTSVRPQPTTYASQARSSKHMRFWNRMQGGGWGGWSLGDHLYNVAGATGRRDDLDRHWDDDVEDDFGNRIQQDEPCKEAEENESVTSDESVSSGESVSSDESVSSNASGDLQCSRSGNSSARKTYTRAEFLAMIEMVYPSNESFNSFSSIRNQSRRH